MGRERMGRAGKFLMPRTKRIVAQSPLDGTIIKELGVQSLYDAHLKYTGAVSGKEYEWSRAGATVMVLAEDVSVLLEKRIGSRSCCGARQGGNKIFELSDLANKEAR